jgi:uncharacterized protein (TIGR04255 family)
MPNPSPHFDRPPVAEAVLGVQFAALPRLHAGNLGWFWKSCLGDEWPNGTDAVPIVEQSETSAPTGKWPFPVMPFSVQAMTSPVRLQITNRAGDRMVQLQRTRFHYNWQRKDDAYPSYRILRPEFDRYFELFRNFVAENGIGEVVPNQWEITYVDHIPPGELWQSLSDWGKVLPGLLGTGAHPEGAGLENVSGTWQYELARQRGRLYVNLNLGTAGNSPTPGILLQTTARGPINRESGQDLGAGLDLGHQAVLEHFLRITSSEAQRAWGRRD